MRVLILTALAGLALASAVSAQPSMSERRHAATLCLDPSGINHPPLCRSALASRMATPPDICQCNGPYRQVDAPYCAAGEKPPADTADFDHARAEAAKHGSSLFGATYQGRRMCVELGDNG